jgi:hypothetical protein
MEECNYAKFPLLMHAWCRKKALYAGCHYTECHYAECRGTILANKKII